MRTCFIAEAKPPVAPHGGSAMPITQGLCGAMTVGQTTPPKRIGRTTTLEEEWGKDEMTWYLPVFYFR